MNENMQMMNWVVYLLLCADGSLYCGITNRPQHRFLAHQSGKGAHYVRMRGAVEMRVIACCLTRSMAARYEYQVKQLPIMRKRALWIEGKKIRLPEKAA